MFSWLENVNVSRIKTPAYVRRKIKRDWRHWGATVSHVLKLLGQASVYPSLFRFFNQYHEQFWSAPILIWYKYLNVLCYSHCCFVLNGNVWILDCVMYQWTSLPTRAKMPTWQDVSEEWRSKPRFLFCLYSGDSNSDRTSTVPQFFLWELTSKTPSFFFFNLGDEQSESYEPV